MNLFNLQNPAQKTKNIIYNCPHSGEKFPAGFFNLTKIDKDTLLASGDSFVDQLYEEASDNGSCLLSNIYARSYIDTNREAFELDPEMFSGKITEKLNTDSKKVRLGFGSIAKYGVTRKDIYKDKIPFEKALERLQNYYFPIHKKLDELLKDGLNKFDYSLLVDCHSMPSYEFLGHPPGHSTQPDIILGDRYGKSCHPAITEFLKTYFEKQALTVAKNSPFAGGFNTQNYGNPINGRHAVQIEIKKSLYMDEFSRSPNDQLQPIKNMMGDLCSKLNEEIEKLIK